MILIIILIVVCFNVIVSSNPQCSFPFCTAMKDLILNETDSPITLPCDGSTPLNTSDTVSGSYSYCKNELLLVNQSSNFYTVTIDSTLDGASICCYNHDQEVCGICYDLTVYCKCFYMCILFIEHLIFKDAPKNQEYVQGPRAFYGQPYTVTCGSVGNPPPVCKWIRVSDSLPSDYMYDGDGFGSAVGLDNSDIVHLPVDAEFSNNGCTMHIPRLYLNYVIF